MLASVDQWERGLHSFYECVNRLYDDNDVYKMQYWIVMIDAFAFRYLLTDTSDAVSDLNQLWLVHTFTARKPYKVALHIATHKPEQERIAIRGA